MLKNWNFWASFFKSIFGVSFNFVEGVGSLVYFSLILRALPKDTLNGLFFFRSLFGLIGVRSLLFNRKLFLAFKFGLGVFLPIFILFVSEDFDVSRK